MFRTQSDRSGLWPVATEYDRLDSEHAECFKSGFVMGDANAEVGSKTNDSCVGQCNVYGKFIQIIEKKLQFITLLTAICIVSHIENSKNDKGYFT